MEDKKDQFLCRYCGSPMAKKWFTEYEEINGVRTGRRRQAVDYLYCLQCFRQEPVDDSMDREWYMGWNG